MIKRLLLERLSLLGISSGMSISLLLVAAEGVAIGAREVIFFKEFEQSRWCNQVLHLSLQSDACTEHYFFMSTRLFN
jgi:hypothetical protein